MVWATFLAWLDRNFRMNRRCGGRQLGVVQKPATHRVMKIDENCLSCSFLGPSSPDAKRQSRVSPCQKSAIRCPTPAVAPGPKSMTHSTSLGKLARVVARVQGQPAGKEVEQRKRAITCAEVRTGNRDDDITACAPRSIIT